MIENYGCEIWSNWLSSTRQYVYFKDKHSRYIGFSECYAEIFGLRAEDTIGKYDYELFPTELAQSFVRQDKQILQTGRSYTYKNVLNHPEKGRIIIEGKKSPIYNSDGEIIGIEGFSFDVTEKLNALRHAKDENVDLQIILDSIPLPVCVKDNDNVYANINTAYEEFFEVNREEVVGKDKFKNLEEKFLSEEEILTLEAQSELVLTTKKKHTLTFCSTSKGKKRCYEIAKSPIIIKGNTAGYVGICRDITDICD